MVVTYCSSNFTYAERLVTITYWLKYSKYAKGLLMHMQTSYIHHSLPWAAQSWLCFVIKSHVWGCTGKLFRFCLSSFCLGNHEFNFPVLTQYPHVLYFHFGGGHEAAVESCQGFVLRSHVQTALTQLWNFEYFMDLTSVTCRSFIHMLPGHSRWTQQLWLKA